jgi:hypothetical protein
MPTTDPEKNREYCRAYYRRHRAKELARAATNRALKRAQANTTEREIA